MVVGRGGTNAQAPTQNGGKRGCRPGYHKNAAGKCVKNKGKRTEPTTPEDQVQDLWDQWLGDNYGGGAWGTGLNELLELLGMTRDDLETYGVDPEYLAWTLTQQYGDYLDWAVENGTLAELLTDFIQNGGQPSQGNAETDLYLQFSAERMEDQGFTQGPNGWGLYDENGQFLGTPGSVRNRWNMGSTGIGGATWEELGVNAPDWWGPLGGEPEAGAGGEMGGGVTPDQGPAYYLALVGDLMPQGTTGTLADFVPSDFAADVLPANLQASAPGTNADRPHGGYGPASANGQGQGQQGQGAGNWESNLYDQLGLGGNGAFDDIIDQAIREGWSDAQFINAIYASPQFDRMFPGIKRPDGTLRMDVASYRSLMETYSAIAGDYGVSINKFRMGLLIAGQVSPDELATRLQAIQNVRANPGLQNTFNEVLGTMGMAPLDEQGWFRFVAGAASPDFYDAYEASLLRSAAGFDFTDQSAVATARAIGTMGQPMDIATLVQQARLMKGDIGPELARAGITDDDLIKLEAGVDPKGLALQLSTIINNRRAKSSYVPGSYTRQGTGGGAAIYEPLAGEAAYG